MGRIDINKPLMVDAVFIKGKPEPLRDRVVFILDNFVIVARDMNDTTPTWYNVNLIEKLVKVKAETSKMHIG